AAAVRARRDDLDLFLARVELEQALAHGDRAAGLEERLAHAHLVDERAVRRVVVEQDVAGVVLNDLAVVARHRVVVQHDVVVFHRADADLFLVEDPLLRRIIDRLQDAAPQVQGGPSVEVADLGRRYEVRELLHGTRADIILTNCRGMWRAWRSSMSVTRARPSKPSPEEVPGAEGFLPARRTLPTLRAAIPTCRGCTLYK